MLGDYALAMYLKHQAEDQASQQQRDAVYDTACQAWLEAAIPRYFGVAIQDDDFTVEGRTVTVDDVTFTLRAQRSEDDLPESAELLVLLPCPTCGGKLSPSKPLGKKTAWHDLGAMLATAPTQPRQACPACSAAAHEQPQAQPPQDQTPLERLAAALSDVLAARGFRRED